MRHLAYGVTIESDVALGVPASRDPAEVTVKKLRQPVDPGSVQWLDRDSDSWMTAGLVADEFYLRFGNEAEFLVTPDGHSLQWHSSEEVSDTLVHLILDHVLPRALMRLDRIVLHGSCVAHDERGCVAILGESGSGKSTLAATLVSRRCSLVADDCVVIQRTAKALLVAAAYPGLRLTDSSVHLSGINGFKVQGPVRRNSPKMRLTSRNSDDPDAPAPRQLLAVVVLQRTENYVPDIVATSSVKLGYSAAGIELLRHSFHLNGPDERAALLERVLPVATACPLFRMYYHHSDAGLRLAAQEIEEILSFTETREVRV